MPKKTLNFKKIIIPSAAALLVLVAAVAVVLFATAPISQHKAVAFVDDYLNFIGELPESHYRKELDAVYNRAQRALGRHGVAVEDDEMSERDFAKERRRLMREARKAAASEK